MTRATIKYEWKDGEMPFMKFEESLKKGKLPPMPPIVLDEDVYLWIQGLIQNTDDAFKDMTTPSEVFRSLVKMVHESDKQATSDDDYIKRLEAEIKRLEEQAAQALG